MANYPTYFQNAPYYQNQPTYQSQPAYACRPVTSREEAVAAQTDYFSAGLVMPDLAHGVIWMKRFNPATGASDFSEFRLAQPETQQPTEYVTRKEFDELIRRLKKEASSNDE